MKETKEKNQWAWRGNNKNHPISTENGLKTNEQNSWPCGTKTKALTRCH